MRWNLPFVWVMALAIVPVLAADDAVKQDWKKLQGAWTVVAAEKDGQPLDRIQGGILTVSEQNFHIKTKSGVELKGDLRIDPSKKPKTMDLAHQDGALRDKTWDAIYLLDGDDLKICYAEADSGKARPTEFKAEQDSGHLLVILKRRNGETRSYSF